MLRRTLVSLLAVTIAFGLASSAGAEAEIRIRPVGTARAGTGTARFRIENATTDTLAFTTYDGGQLHNGLEHLDEQGRWVGGGLGYCGLGMDGEVTVAPGASHTVGAHVGMTAGTYRIRVQLTRRRADGTTAEDEIVSEPIRVR